MIIYGDKWPYLSITLMEPVNCLYASLLWSITAVVFSVDCVLLCVQVVEYETTQIFNTFLWEYDCGDLKESISSA